MRSVAAAKFKEQCLSLLDQLDSEGLVITKHGKPVAKVIAIENTHRNLLGALKGKISVAKPGDDLFSTGIAWGGDGENLE